MLHVKLFITIVNAINDMWFLIVLIFVIASFLVYYYFSVVRPASQQVEKNKHQVSSEQESPRKEGKDSLADDLSPDPDKKPNETVLFGMDSDVVIYYDHTCEMTDISECTHYVRRRGDRVAQQMGRDEIKTLLNELDIVKIPSHVLGHLKIF